MEYIPPKERFNHHASSKKIPNEILEPALLKFGFKPALSTIQRLSGGFMNANFLVECDGKKVVLRIYSTDSATAQREFDLLRYLETRSLQVPKALRIFEIQDRPIVFLEFLEGCTLEDKLLSAGKSATDLQIFEDLGSQLGRIHAIRFQSTGFIGPQLAIGNEYEDFSVFIREFIERSLVVLEGQTDRLDLSTNQRLRQLVKDQWPMVLATEPVRQLVHTDFNPKNILVSRDFPSKLLGVIDWEFALSGNGLCDLGNFFRFSYDYPEGAKQHFMAAYRSSNPQWPGIQAQNWEAVSKLLDLGNICSFLIREENYPKTFRSARAVIAETLKYFAY